MAAAASAGRVFATPAVVLAQRAGSPQPKGGAGIGVEQASLHALETHAIADGLRRAGQAGTAEPTLLGFAWAPSISMLISSSEVSPDLPSETRIMSSRIST
jgi:hypothetical protein